uniref:Uncharacterized protein n=1 Tax=termite gut metagenome TaxID=433724 RepID=S0DG69_9ZZZZ
MDPPAGTDKNPRLEQVANVTFEDEEFDPGSFDYYAYEDGQIAAIEDDDAHGKVLHMPGGYARMANPLNTVQVQNGVSLTFWVKQALFTDEETGDELENDLAGALFSFENANGTQRMYFTANGELVYEGVDGEYVANAATDVKTGMLSPAGEWHYVALTVRDNGYNVFVDNRQRIDKTETNFDFAKIVRFMAGASYLYIGYGADVATKEMWIDDLAVYRNQIGNAERVINIGGAEEVYERYVTVGATDNTTAYAGAFAPMVTIQNGETLHMSFVNHTSGTGGNWNSWALFGTNGKLPDETDFVHYFALRNDNWENVSWGNANITSDFNWDTFVADMNGATVDMTIDRTGNTIVVTSVITTTTGTVYNYEYTYTNESMAATFGAFLTVDNSHLVLDRKTVFISQKYAPGSLVVGATDNSSNFFAEFSPLMTLKGDNTLKISFVNYSPETANYFNWVFVLTNNKAFGADGYKEHFVIRADAFGWGDGSYGSHPSQDWASNEDDWVAFRTDMNGATVDITMVRGGDTITLTSVTVGKSGKVYTQRFTYINSDMEESIGAFLTEDHSHIEMISIGQQVWSPIKE